MPRKAASPAHRNQNGQAMGAKGMQTRRRLVEATSQLLKATSLRDLTVSEIAREAGTSASTFYLYFNDVPDAVLEAIRGVSQSTPQLLELLERPWPPAEMRRMAEEFVHSYVQTWKMNAHLFRVRNLAADEGDERYASARRLAIGHLLQALSRRIAQSDPGRTEVEATALAGALMAMIERLASIPQHAAGNATLTYDHIIDAAAYFVTCAMAPPPGVNS